MKKPTQTKKVQFVASVVPKRLNFDGTRIREALKRRDRSQISVTSEIRIGSEANVSHLVFQCSYVVGNGKSQGGKL